MSFDDAVVSRLPLALDVAAVLVLDSVRERVRRMGLKEISRHSKSLASLLAARINKKLGNYCDTASRANVMSRPRFHFKIGLRFAFDKRAAAALRLAADAEQRNASSLNGLLRSTKKTIIQSGACQNNTVYRVQAHKTMKSTSCRQIL